MLVAAIKITASYKDSAAGTSIRRIGGVASSLQPQAKFPEASDVFSGRLQAYRFFPAADRAYASG
jgi:hypothetical protein